MKKVLYVLLFIVVFAQFFKPEKNISTETKPVDFYAETLASREVQEILETSCTDCHSNHTNYPWYNHLTPVNYFLAAHIEDGKKHLNFSEWKNYGNERKEHKMDEIVEMVKKKEMPLPSYLMIHQEAELSENQIDLLVDWAKDAEKIYK